nr:MAG TPA: hypothetical protein [Caudoviricetes sp.]
MRVDNHQNTETSTSVSFYLLSLQKARDSRFASFLLYKEIQGIKDEKDK